MNKTNFSNVKYHSIKILNNDKEIMKKIFLLLSSLVTGLLFLIDPAVQKRCHHSYRPIMKFKNQPMVSWWSYQLSAFQTPPISNKKLENTPEVGRLTYQFLGKQYIYKIVMIIKVTRQFIPFLVKIIVKYGRNQLLL